MLLNCSVAMDIHCVPLAKSRYITDALLVDRSWGILGV
ncbi:hypothetical protein LINPERPRIM_LOCUS7491 [Linum perenne]